MGNVVFKNKSVFGWKGVSWTIDETFQFFMLNVSDENVDLVEVRCVGQWIDEFLQHFDIWTNNWLFPSFLLASSDWHEYEKQTF